MQRLARAAAGVLCLVVSSIPVGVAAAATATPDGGVVALAVPAVSPRTPMVEDDASITVVASGFCAGQGVSFSLTGAGGTVAGGTVAASAAGSASYTYTADRVGTGDYAVWARQRPTGLNGCHLTAVNVVRVVADCSTAPGAVILQPTEFRRTDNPLDAVMALLVPPPESSTTTTEAPTTTSSTTTTTTEPPTTTTTEPPTTTTTEPPTTTTSSTTTTSTTTTTTTTTTTIPATTTTLAPVPPGFPSGNVACDAGPEPAAPATTTTLPGPTTTEPAQADQGGASPSTSGEVGVPGLADRSAPGSSTGSTSTDETTTSSGSSTSGSRSTAPRSTTGTQPAPDPGVITVSEPDDDTVELEVTHYEQSPSRVEAKGFCGGSVVTFSVGGVVVGAVLAGPDGTAKFTIPSTSLPDEVGEYEVVASSIGNEDSSCDVRETADFVVPQVASSSPGSGSSSGDGTGAGGASGTLGPLVVDGKLNPELFESGKVPINNSSSVRLVRLIGAGVGIGLVVMVAIGLRRRRNFAMG
ncbi:MAG: hypothetical protein AB7L17_19585 [Ilumatobacteraceae bacterium]